MAAALASGAARGAGEGTNAGATKRATRASRATGRALELRAIFASADVWSRGTSNIQLTSRQATSMAVREGPTNMPLAKDPAVAKAGGLGVRCTALGPNAKEDGAAVEKSSSATVVHVDMQVNSEQVTCHWVSFSCHAFETELVSSSCLRCQQLETCEYSLSRRLSKGNRDWHHLLSPGKMKLPTTRSAKAPAMKTTRKGQLGGIM